MSLVETVLMVVAVALLVSLVVVFVYQQIGVAELRAEQVRREAIEKALREVHRRHADAVARAFVRGQESMRRSRG